MPFETREWLLLLLLLMVLVFHLTVPFEILRRLLVWFAFAGEFGGVCRLRGGYRRLPRTARAVGDPWRHHGSCSYSWELR